MLPNTVLGQSNKIIRIPFYEYDYETNTNLGGYIDDKGNTVIEPQFESVSKFREGLAIVRLNNKYGFIDLKGNIVIQPIYDYAQDFSNGLAAVIKDKNHFYIDKHGQTKITLPDGVAAYSFSEEMAAVYYLEKARWGFIDKNGKIIIPPKFGNYDGVPKFKNGLAKVYINDKYGYINKKGEYAIEPQYLDAEDFLDEYAIVRDFGANGKYKMIDLKGKVIKVLNSYSRGFNEGLALQGIPGKDGGHWWFVNEKWEKVIDLPRGLFPKQFSDGMAAVYSVPEGKWGYINYKGEFVVLPIYTNEYYEANKEYRESLLDFENGFAEVENGLISEIINKKGEVVKSWYRNPYAFIKLKVNGEYVKLSTLIRQTNYTNYVPLREVLDVLGLKVSWDQTKNTVVGENKDLKIVVNPKNSTALVNGENRIIEPKVFTYSGTVMVPIRFIAESTGVELYWNQDTKTINMSTKNKL